jgi:hypothetical protein
LAPVAATTIAARIVAQRMEVPGIWRRRKLRQEPPGD